METVVVKARVWGNSVGVVLPKELGVEPNEEIMIRVNKVGKHGKAGAIWGLLKGDKHDTQKILDELNEE